MRLPYEDALNTLRIEAMRFSGDRTDRVFMADQLDRIEAWMAELEHQHSLRAAQPLPESPAAAQSPHWNKSGTSAT